MFGLENKIIQVTNQWKPHSTDNYNFMFKQKIPLEKAT